MSIAAGTVVGHGPGWTFDAIISPAELLGEHDVWDVRVKWGTDGPESPVGPGRSTNITTVRNHLDDTPVTVYVSAAGGLAIDVGGDPHSLPLETRADSVIWVENDASAEPAVQLVGRIALADITVPASATLVLRRKGGSESYEIVAGLDQTPGPMRYTALIPLLSAAVDRPLPRGDWNVSLMLGLSGIRRHAPILAPPNGLQHHWWRRGRPMLLTTSKAPDPLVISVRPLML
jgi:hypothetical protein